MSYKIVASDLDGTLLNSRSKVSNENLLAISELTKKGVYFVPSTGRTFSEIPVELKNNPDIRYVIHSNGAVVFDKLTQKRIMNCISNADGRYILDVLASCDSHITIRQNGECFVDTAMQTKQLWDYYNLCEAHRVVVRDYAAHLPEFEKFSSSADNVEVFSAFFHSYDEKIACKKQLAQNTRFRVVEADEYNLEIINANAGKGNALYALADMLGVNYADTIAIGDSDNDNSIVQASGLGLAVSNATNSLKAVADEIISSNDEHAIDYVLARYFS